MSKSFEKREGWIWMNGQFIPWANATSHIISQDYIMLVRYLKEKEHMAVKFSNLKSIPIVFLIPQK